MHLGATLRLLRTDAGLSLRDLARRIGVSSAYLSRVENGVDAPPTPERLSAIAHELRVPPSLLMDVAHRVSPFVTTYLEEVPGAGALFQDIAQRRLAGPQLARVRDFLDAEFPVAPEPRHALVPPLGPLLAPERVVLQLACAGWDDVLDVVAERLASSQPGADVAHVLGGLKQHREASACAVGNGVAVPHAFLPGTAPTAALVTLATPLAGDTPDGKPLRLVVAVLDGERGSPRLVRLAHLARLASHGLADHLLGLSQPAQVLSVLEDLEALR